MLAEYQFTKIPVGCEQHRSVSIRQTQDKIICDAWRHLGDSTRRMTGLPQSLDNRPINTFVSQKVHATASTNG